MATHATASLYETFSPEEAQRLAERIEIHYTPKQHTRSSITERRSRASHTPETAPHVEAAFREIAAIQDLAAQRRVTARALASRTRIGSGHFCQLEAPEQVNDMIDRLLAIMPPS